MLSMLRTAAVLTFHALPAVLYQGYLFSMAAYISRIVSFLFGLPRIVHLRITGRV